MDMIAFSEVLRLTYASTFAYVTSNPLSKASMARIIGIPENTLISVLSNASKGGIGHTRSPHSKTIRRFAFCKFLPEDIRHAWIVAYAYVDLCRHGIIYTAHDFPRWRSEAAVAA